MAASMGQQVHHCNCSLENDADDPKSPKTAVFFDIFSSSSAKVLQVGDQLSGIHRPVAPALVKRLLRRKLQMVDAASCGGTWSWQGGAQNAGTW